MNNISDQNWRALRLLDEWQRVEFREMENTVGDKDLLPDVIYGYIDRYGLCRWSETYDSVRAVAPPYAFAKYVRAATVLDITPQPEIIGRLVDYAMWFEAELDDAENHTCQVPDGGGKAECDRCRWQDALRGMQEIIETLQKNVPDITHAERQTIEVLRLAEQAMSVTCVYVSGAKSQTRWWSVVDNKQMSLPDAITELRSRLEPPKPPQRPTEQEWFDIATAPVTLEAKWEAMKLLRDRHLAADKRVAAQGGDSE